MDMKELINLKNQRKTAVDALEQKLAAKQAAQQSGDQSAIDSAAAAFDAQKAVVAAYNAQIEDAEQVVLEKGRFDKGDARFVGLQEAKQHEEEELGMRKQLDKVRGDREYMKAFQTALQLGETRTTASQNEAYAPLVKALTISGGTTVGEDGGFLVPLDFDKKIITETKDFFDISALCNKETVTTNSGWRAVEVAGQRTKLPEIQEMGTVGTANQPKFKKVSYTLRQFGDRLPVSNQLIQDVDYLMSYLAQWYGPKLVLTRNDLILTLLNSLSFTAQSANTDAAKMAAIKHILNVDLNTAHSRAASLLMGQTVYDAMDNWTDGNGRAMLVPDISGDFSRLKNRPVHCMDSDEIGVKTVTETVDVSSVTTTYDPLYIGNFRKFATLFDRGVMEMAATNVGGNAWATNSTEIRLICRMDAQAVDTSAVIATGYARANG